MTEEKFPAVTLPDAGSIELGPTGIAFKRTPSPAELAHVRDFLLSTAKASAWWWGDYLQAVGREHQARRDELMKRDSRALGSEDLSRIDRCAIAPFAEMAGISVGRLG